MIFLSTPAFYLSSLSILNEGRLRVRSYTLYFIGPAVFTILFGLYNAITAPALIQELGAAPGQFSTPVLTILTALAFSGYGATVILALLSAHRIWKSGRVRDIAGFRHQVFFLLLYLTAALNGLISIIRRDERLFVIDAFLFCPIILAFGITRVSGLYVKVGSANLLRPAQSKPDWDKNAGTLSVKLDGLMKNVAPYRNENLTLKRLAQMLGVDPLHLTYQLHRHSATNFRTYINGWRLEAVSRDLIRHQESSILEIAFRNGFNSKSSFNTLFYKKFGMTRENSENNEVRYL